MMAGNVVRVYEGFVYRNGSRSDRNMTPRSGDVSSDLRDAGLSTWRELAGAIEPGGKGQKIDLALLDSSVIGCYQDEDGHVAIVPVEAAGMLDMMKLAEWASARNTSAPHPLTTMIVNAIVDDNVRRPL